MEVKTSIGFNITNNTTATQRVSILGAYFNQLDTSNATTQYSWDVTGFTFTTENQVSLLYKTTSQINFSVYTNTLSGQNISSVLTALNALGVGYFYTYTSGGNTYIATINDNVIFDSLNIYDPTVPYVFYAIYQAFAGGSGTIATPAQSVVWGTPLTATQTPLLSVAGQFVNVNGTTDSTAATAVVITETNNNTLVSTQIFNSGYPPLTGFSTTFTSQAGFTYLIDIYN
jgi:hypothetical protein